MIFAVTLERGGPWDWSRELRAREVRERLAADNWHRNGMLTTHSIRTWTVVLDGLRATRAQA